MRKTLLLLFISISFTSFSQIKFQTSSFSDALAKAKSNNKMIFLQLEAEDCNQCNESVNVAFAEKELSHMVNETFVPLYIAKEHPDRKQIERLYNLPSAFGTLFIDQNSTLIHRYAATSTMPDTYRKQIILAFTKKEENSKIIQLENDFKNGKKTLSLAEKIIIYKNEQGLDKTSILDEYVSLLPSDSLTSIYTLQFIAKMAPVLGSKADVALRRNNQIFNKAWYSMPSNQRTSINTRIINASLNKAARDNDEKYAIRIASFAKATITSTKEAAERYYYYRLMDYYDRSENKEKYLLTAVHFYDNYFMTINVDSVKKIDERKRDSVKNLSKRDTTNTETGFIVRSTFGYSPITQSYTKTLKNGAWNVYKLTSDPIMLEKAITWIRRGLEFFETFEAYEIYSHLLYKVGNKEEAIKTQKKAIEQKKEVKLPVTYNLEILAKMEKGLPL